MQNYRKRMAGEKLEQQYCFRVVRPNGDLIWVEINAVQMVWNFEPAILVFLMDMTERKNHDDMLVEQAATLREKAKLQEKLNEELRIKNKELDEHQEELSDYAEELKAVLEEIAVKNERIERTNQDMKDSIEYARIIQDAVLQTTDEISGLYNHFVLYIPKDIVSGDFYYFKKTNNLTMFAVADCTGHGVPGGFLTILGVNLLQEVIAKADLTKPHQILEEMRRKVKNVFHFSRHHDGLDIAICVYDHQSRKLYYASANMPIVIINGDKKQKFDPTPNPIGYYISEVPFELQEINITPGDTLYMFSDGIKDQFGGNRQKKYQLKNLIKLLETNNHKSMAEQKQIVFDEYKSWKGTEMQLDDITLIGVKLD
jgi:serine phosphatase RsbU (regulator of sigma subunit)